jgi:hypothetical protein
LLPARFVLIALLPPLIGAIGFTATALRRPDRLRRNRNKVAIALALLLAVAIGTRFDASGSACFAYSNLTPILLAISLVAIATLIGLGAGSWIRRSRRAALTGVIACDDAQTDVVAYYEITSWLRGPQVVMRPFVVTTPTGDIPIPHGAKLVAPLPEITTRLRAAESIAILRCGDKVALRGFIEPDAHHPFRDSLTPVAGDLVSVHTLDDDSARGLAPIALAVWRPCVAYILILIGIGVPALTAALTSP